MVGGPIVNAVKINAGGENIGIAAEPESSEITTVASAPKPDARGVHIAAALQIFPGGNDIAILGGAAAGARGSFAEIAAITDSTAVVHGQNDIATAGEVLVHRVGIRVVIHVMPAEKHLPNRAAVHEDESGFLFP